MPEDVIYNFSGKNFIVTGASSGLGRQVAVELAQAGATVLAVARRQAGLEALAAEYPAIVPAAADVRDYDALEAHIKSFVVARGKLHGSVHAAGIMELTPVKAYDEQLARDIMDISFWSGIKLVQLATKTANANNGTINILISSTSGSRGPKAAFAYSAAKAAMRIAVQSVAKEIVAKKHRVLTVSPGYMDTEMTARGGEITGQDIIDKHILGTGKPEYVSGVILFLLSSRASWMTGTDVVVDGGFLA